MKEEHLNVLSEVFIASLQYIFLNNMHAETVGEPENVYSSGIFFHQSDEVTLIYICRHNCHVEVMHPCIYK